MRQTIVFIGLAILTSAASAATLQFSPTSVIAREGLNTAAKFTVTRTGDTTAAASVTFTTADGTATAASGDYTATTQTLSWAAGDATSRAVNVPIADDLLGENQETFTATLSAPTGDTLGAATATATLKDNDVSFSFSVASQSVKESVASVTVTVKRTGGDTSDFAGVNVFPLAGGTATDGVDFDFPGTNIPLDFPAGTTSKSFTIPILQDSRDEPNETFQLELRDVFISPNRTGIPGAIPVVTVTIVDDDSLFSVAATRATVAENVGNVVVTVKRLNGAAGAASVQFTTADGNATAPADYAATSGTLTWADGDAVAKTVTIPIADDAASEPKEGFYFVLSNPTGGQISSASETIFISANDGGETAKVFENAANQASPLGTNLAVVTDYATEFPFSNFFKSARFWISGNDTTFTFDDHRTFNLDANDFITGLKPNQVARAMLFTGTPADPSLTGRQFVLRFDGDGDFAYPFGATRLSHAAGRDVIQLTGGDATHEASLQVELTRTNPANPVKNIRLTPIGGICRSNPLGAVSDASKCTAGDFVSFEDAATAGEIVFNPEFLLNLKKYRTLRFLNWQAANNSALVNFADRPKLADAFWAVGEGRIEDQNPQHVITGVPLEAIIALVNLMDADAWVHVPHQASDDFITQFAALFASQLETGRKVYVEYSNETWNCLFQQCDFVRQQGRALNLAPDDATAGSRFTSQRAQFVFDKFDAAFGAARAARVIRVLAGQSANTGVLEAELAFDQAAAKTDNIAIAPYFGETLTSQAQIDAVKALGADGIFDWLTNDNVAVLPHGSLPSIDREVANHLAKFAPFGIPTVTYEGGQHFLAPNRDSDTALNGLLDSVNRDPRMKGTYTTYLGNWRARTATQFNHFQNVERWSVSGRWGSKEFPTQARAAAPKFDALQTYIETQPLTGRSGFSGAWDSPTTSQCFATGGTCVIFGTLQVTNPGVEEASASVIALYLSHDQTFDDGDLLVKEIALDPLAAGQTVPVEINASLGPSPAGQYAIAVLDANNDVDEVNEDNNVVVSGPIEDQSPPISPPPTPSDDSGGALVLPLWALLAALLSVRRRTKPAHGGDGCARSSA